MEWVQEFSRPPEANIREIDLSEFENGASILVDKLGKVSPRQLAMNPDASGVQNPIKLAYSRLGLEEKNIPVVNRFTEDEAEAFNTMYGLLRKAKLTGDDGVFDRGDIDALVDALPVYSKFFARKQFNGDNDLLTGQKPDRAKRNVSVGELLKFRSARDVLVKYADRIGHKPMKSIKDGAEPVAVRHVPNTRKSFVAFVKALLLGKDVADSVVFRALD